jgi:hypothetical protein
MMEAANPEGKKKCVSPLANEALEKYDNDES